MQGASVTRTNVRINCGSQLEVQGFQHIHGTAKLTVHECHCHCVAAGDLRFSSTTSTEPPSPLSGLKNGYFDVIMALAGYDPEVRGSLQCSVGVDACQSLSCIADGSESHISFVSMSGVSGVMLSAL